MTFIAFGQTPVVPADATDLGVLAAAYPDADLNHQAGVNAAIQSGFDQLGSAVNELGSTIDALDARVTTLENA
jgi:hypothetical protein